MEHLKQAGVSTLALDVTSSDSIANVVRFIEAQRGAKLDILVNNCGIGHESSLPDASLDETRKVFETNVFGPLALMQAFAPLLIAARGTVLNIGSKAGMKPKPWSGVYHTAYRALHQLSDIVCLELEPLGVKLVLVITGSVKTQFLSSLPATRLAPSSRYLLAEESIEKTMNTAVAGARAMDATEYAERVAANVMESEPKRRVWADNLVTAIWAVYTFLWDTARDWILVGPFGIAELRKKLQMKQKAL